MSMPIPALRLNASNGSSPSTSRSPLVIRAPYYRGRLPSAVMHGSLDQVNLGLLVLRVAVGVTMIAHGYNHIYRGGKIAGTGRWFASLGMKPGWLHAWLASTTELAAGAGLIVGLLTPWAAGALIGVVLVAWITNHRHAGFFVFRRPIEGWEYLMNLAAALFAIACLG